MKTILCLVFLVITSAFLFTLTIKGVIGKPDANDIRNKLEYAGSPFESSPERGRFLVTLNLAENHTFALTQEMADAAYPDVGYHDGRYYHQTAPGVSIIALPFYELGKNSNLGQLMTFSMVAIFTILNLIFLFLISKSILKLSFFTSLVVAIIYGFSSTGWSYSTTLYQHQITVFFMLSSFYFVWRYKQKGVLSFLWTTLAWLEFGLSITVDYPNAILLSPIMIYLLLSSVKFKNIDSKFKVSLRPIYIFSVIGLLLVAFWIGKYDNDNFGGPFKTSQTITSYKALKEGIVANNQQAIAKADDQRIPSSIFTEYSLVNGAYELLFAPDKGVFIFSPILFLGLLGIYLKRHSLALEDGVLIGLILVNFSLYASFGDPYGGWAFGPRYFIPSMAFLALYTGVFLEYFRYHLAAKIITLVLFCYSTAVALLGALTTNAVPPQIEADYLHMKYGYFYNMDFFFRGQSSSFAYNSYFHNLMSLQEYFLYIYIFLIIIGTTLIMFIPSRRNHEH